MLQTTITVPWDGVHTFTCSGGSPFNCGQTFVAPLTASVLQSFTFPLQTPSTLTFQLHALNGTQIVGPALFTQTFGPTAGFQPQTFVPAGGLTVLGGAPYVALVQIDAGEQVVFQSNWSGAYTDGNITSCDPFQCPPDPFPIDLAFSATFASTVPEPSTLALVLVGFVALVRVRKTKRWPAVVRPRRA